MALKPTHRKALVEILTTGEYDTPDDMAKALVEKLDELRAHDTTYVVVRNVLGSLPMAYGPYPTRASAIKAMERGTAGLADGTPSWVMPLYSPQHWAQRMAEAMEFPEVHKGHWVQVREQAGVA